MKEGDDFGVEDPSETKVVEPKDHPCESTAHS